VVRDADAGAGDTRGPGPDERVLSTPEPGTGGVSPEPVTESRADDVAPESGDKDAKPARGTAGGGADDSDDPSAEDDPPAEDDSEDVDPEDADPEREADWVNGPVGEAVPLEEAPASDDVADWINGPEEAEPVTVEVPDRSDRQPDQSAGGADEPADGDQPAPVPDMGASDPAAPSAPTDQVLAHVPEEPHAAPAEDEAGDVARDERDTVDRGDLGEDQRVTQGESGDEEGKDDQHLGEPTVDDADLAARQESDDLAPIDDRGADDHGADDHGAGDHGADDHGAADSGQRLGSRLDEVVDGGHGVGSAAPIADGAQPLGHPIKAWRDTMTYVIPGGRGYDGGEPDVWFQSEQAALAAGYRRGGA
jgi:hypothetical protein